MKAWIKARLKERTTWYALAALASVFGYNVTPEYIGEIVSAVITVGALIEGAKEQKK